MLNPQEKRFIKYWQEQRTGGKWAYFLLYILGGAFIISLIAFIVVLFFLQIPLQPYMLWLVPAASLLLAVAMTAAAWTSNEKKWKAIIKREIEQGKSK